MGTGAARPTSCAICNATPICPGTNCNKCNHRQQGTCLIGYWDWRCFVDPITGNIVYYVVCPSCWKKGL